MRIVALYCLIWIIKFIVTKRKYKIEKIIEHKNAENKFSIQYFLMGTRIVYIKTINNIIKDKKLLASFSPLDACLIGYLSTQ